MSLEVDIQGVHTHLSIQAAGEYSLADLCALFDRVREESDKRADQGVILDLVNVAGTIPVLDMLVLGEHCASVWKQASRTAIVSPMGGLDRFFENVARNKGVQLVVVPNQCAAMEWLDSRE